MTLHISLRIDSNSHLSVNCRQGLSLPSPSHVSFDLIYLQPSFAFLAFFNAFKGCMVRRLFLCVFSQGRVFRKLGKPLMAIAAVLISKQTNILCMLRIHLVMIALMLLMPFLNSLFIAEIRVLLSSQVSPYAFNLAVKLLKSFCSVSNIADKHHLYL